MSLGEELIEASLRHTEKATINSVTNFFNPIINPKVDKNDIGFLQYSTSKEFLPVTIPLKGGGHLSLGLGDPHSVTPKAFIELDYQDTHLTEESEKLKRTLHKGQIEFMNAAGRFAIMNADSSLKDNSQKELYKALARLNIQKEVDVDQLKEPTKEQKWLLAQFGITLS